MQKDNYRAFHVHIVSQCPSLAACRTLFRQAAREAQRSFSNPDTKKISVYQTEAVLGQSFLGSSLLR